MMLLWAARSVIESDDNLMIVERQRLPVLHTADSSEFAWADREYATRTKRIWISWARVR
jgi:hypothetical protein